MVGGKGTGGGKGRPAANPTAGLRTIDDVVQRAVNVVRGVADKHTQPAPQGEHARTHPTPPPRRAARPQRRVPRAPQGENAATRPLPPKPLPPATPIVTEHTRGQVRGAPVYRAGVYVTPSTGQRPSPTRPGFSLSQVAHAADFLTGGVGSGALDLIEHPTRHLFPTGRVDAQGRPLPLAQQPLSQGIIPWGAPGRLLKGLGKTAAEDIPHEPVPHEPPVEPPVEPPPRTPKQQVSGALRGAKIVRGKQEVGYSTERAKRAAAAAQIMKDNPGIAGHHAALASLRGELPKINFGGFKELTPDALDALAKHIHEHPHLMPYQKITAVSALEKATEGKVPTNSEIRLLTNIFGKNTTAGLVKIHTLPDHLKNVVLEALNVPRSVMASFDLSAPFRQALMAGARHPVIFRRNFRPMIQSFAKEGTYQAVEDEIRARPTFHMMHAAKLAITDMESGFTNREEQLYGYLMAEKIPVAGHAIRGSGRAYNAFLTKMRADVFDHLVKGFQEQGINVHDEEFLKALGRYINASTGRGDLGALQGAAPYLNTLFFSPRLLASRLNFMNPVFYARLPAPIRKEALRSALQLTGLVSTTLGLAALGGAKVVHDPRNADFAKIRLGNTRLDVLGGFQQPIRLLSQLASGKIISSTTGDPLALGPQGPGAVSRRDIVQRFFEGKLAPVPSVVNDWFKGTNFQGQPFSWKQEAVQHMTPLLAQDAADLYNQRQGGMNGIAAAVAGYGIGTFGVGLQTYGPKARTNPTSAYEKKMKSIGMTMTPAIQQAIQNRALRGDMRAKYPKTAHGRLYAAIDANVQLGRLTAADAANLKKVFAAKSEWFLTHPAKNATMSPSELYESALDPTGVLKNIDKRAAFKRLNQPPK